MLIDGFALIAVSGLTIYVYSLYRLVLKRCARVRHSNTSLRKLRKRCSLLSQFMGFYLLKDNVLTEKWLKPALIFTNSILLIIPTAIGCFALQCVGSIASYTFQNISAVLGGINFLLLATLYFLVKALKKSYWSS